MQTLHVRSVQPGTAPMEIDLVAVPWDTPASKNGRSEMFARGAVDAAAAVGLPVAWLHQTPIGRITAADGSGDGLAITVTLSDTALARDAHTLARDGVLGASVGFLPDRFDIDRAGTMVHRAVDLREVSLTHIPVYPGTTVLAVRDRGEATMSDPTSRTGVVGDLHESIVTDAEVRSLLADMEQRSTSALGEVRDQIAALQVGSQPPESGPAILQYRSFGEFVRAVREGEIEARALADQITGNNPGATSRTWLSDIKGIVDLGRPFITGTGGASGLPDSGAADWPYFDGDLSTLMGAQATEKTAITSARVDIKRGVGTINTYAGGSDISYQLLQRSSPAYVDAYMRILLNAWLAITEKSAVAAAATAATGSVTYDPAAEGSVHTAIVEASLGVYGATGQPPSIIAVRWDSWASVAGAVDADGHPRYPAYNPTNVSGQATSPGALAIEIAGLPAVPCKGLTTVPFLVTNQSAFKWGEDGPMTVAAENVELLGRDVAVYGYGAAQPYIPAGIVKVASA